MRKLLFNKWSLLLLLAIAGGGYFYWQKSHQSPAGERYKTQAVEYGNVSQTVSANGTLNPVVLVSVGTQVSGTVKKLYADFNGRVRQGQILMELDASLFQAQVRQSEANVANAEAALELASANETRSRGLYAKEYVSKQELDQATQALKSARAQVALARAQAEKDRTNLGYSIIRSPVSGVVVDRTVDVGQTVAASFQTPTLFKIAQDLRKMQIDSSFAEADVGNIREGQPVRFTVDAFPSRSFKAAVRQVRLNPTTQQNVVTYDVVVAVDNPEQILMPGMTAYVNIVVAERKNVLLIPNAALRFKPADAAEKTAKRNGNGRGRGQGRGKEDKQEGASGTVYVLSGNQLKPVKVKTGITDNRYTEVVGGDLKDGDQVVVEDAQASGSAATTGQPPSTLRMRMF
jgi:HlyD family secretion protein